MNDTYNALIQFVLEADAGLDFLRHWNEGNFVVCRMNWPEAPEEVYPGEI